MAKKTLSKTRLTVVVPVFNEADALLEFLPALLRVCDTRKWAVIFVNDGSTDDSSRLLDTCKDRRFVKVINHKVNRGYGGALKSGILETETDYVVTIDGDGQHSIDDIERIFQFALERNADLVIGNRGYSKNASRFRSIGKWLIRWFTKLLMPLPIRDLNSGFKLYRTELVQRYLPLCPNSMAFSDLITMIFINQHDLVLECPITVRERKTGKSTIGVQTAFETVIEITSLVMLFNPLKIFLPASIFCITIGIGWGVPFILLGRGVSVGAMLAIVLGTLFLAIGLLASQLSAIRMGLLNKQ